jgi:hypothetical protein
MKISALPSGQKLQNFFLHFLSQSLQRWLDLNI